MLRIVMMGLVLSGTPFAPAPATAQDASPIPSPPALRPCLVNVAAAQIKPGEYAVALQLLRFDDGADLRVDDRNGHWTYSITGAHAILEAPTTSPDVAVSVVGHHRGARGSYACGPQMAPLYPADSAPYGTDVIATVGHVPLTEPSAAFSDPPATCAMPFSEPTTLHAATVIPPAGTATGSVWVEVDLAADSSIADAKIADSTNHSLDASALAAARASTFITWTFRCHGFPSKVVYGIDYGR